MNATKAMDWIRLLFAQIDKVIYWLISVTYSMIIKLSETSIFKAGNIEDFASRVYAFLGVIMLFKVTFSLITYLIDPDAISDKTRGTGNLIKNIIITLFLIIIVPYGFDLLYRAQSAIINDNLIPKLILGTTDTKTTYLTINMDEEVCGDTLTVVDTYGDYLAAVTMRPFLQVYSDGKAELIASLESDFPEAKEDYCAKPVSAKLSRSVMYADTTSWNNGQYIFDYSFFVSTAFGILIFLLLLNFCFDIAVRTIKLGFLEIVAPIPIISYIDPKSGKDGIFKKWYKEVFNTWASLFIRLAVIYFAVYIIEIINTNVDSINEESGPILMLFLTIGALMFAKQAPGLIENIFGIKFNHTVQLNPFKKVSDQALGGKQLLGAATATGAMGLSTIGAVGANTINTFKNRDKLREKNPDDKHIVAKRMLSGVGTGILNGSWNGLTMGYNAGKNGKYNVLKTSMDAVEKSSSDRNLSESLVEQHVVGAGPFAKQRYMAKDKFSDVVGLQGKTGTTDELKEKLKQLNVQINLSEDMKRQSNDFITNFKQSASDAFKDALNTYNPFNRASSGLNDDGTVNWTNKLMSYDEFIRKNAISFSSQLEADNFKRDYETYYKAEMQYRKSFDETLRLQKQQSKLTGEQEKFKNTKAKASQNK